MSGRLLSRLRHFFRTFPSSLSARLRRRAAPLLTFGAALALLAGAGCSQLELKERELTFRVVPGTASWYSGLPEGVSEMWIDVPAKGKTEKIHAWWWPAEKRNAPTLLYLHGARWNLTGHTFRIERLREFGFSVLAIDYRGFGKSSGDVPSETTVYEDSRAAWKEIERLQPDPAKRFIYGHSLGGAVAIDLAANLPEPAASTFAPGQPGTAASVKKKVSHGVRHAAPHGAPATPMRAGGLIVESSFTTLADIARSFSYPWLPMQLLLSQKFDSLDKIARVDVPVLIVHGTDDRYVPSRFSQQLFDAATARKKLLLIEGGTHNNSMRIGAPAYRQAFTELFGWSPAPAS